MHTNSPLVQHWIIGLLRSYRQAQGCPAGPVVWRDLLSLRTVMIHFSPALQRTAMATDAMYLMMRHAFDEPGYRRYEWKCDALNAPSRRAALRYGFTFEGIFRQALVYKGRNRDTAWYSIIDGEWQVVRSAFEAWLDVNNFDASGEQRQSLVSLMPAATEQAV